MGAIGEAVLVIFALFGGYSYLYMKRRSIYHPKL